MITISMKPVIKKRVIRRLQIVEGQVKALQRQITDEKYCIDILNQTTAVKQALSGIEDVLLENHLSTCVVSQMKKGDARTATKEILHVYSLSKKK